MTVDARSHGARPSASPCTAAGCSDAGSAAASTVCSTVSTRAGTVAGSAAGSPRRCSGAAERRGPLAPPPTIVVPPDGSDVAPRAVYTPVHQFVTGRRRAQWSSRERMPPRLYVDCNSLIREVSDVRQLRRGDHCMITLNVLRCLSPRIDYLVSLMGSLELFHLYHHFIMLDDVHQLDKHGVPLTSTGDIASILEYSNTLPEFAEELRVAALGRWWRMPPVAVWRLLMHKAKCHRVPLADYGDMPHIFRVERILSEQERDRVVHAAERLLVDHPRYNVIWSNCEHTTNMVTQREFKSPEVRFVVWSLFRYVLTLIGLVLFHVALVGCYRRYCLQYPVWALVGYYLLTAVPVLLQSLVEFVWKVWTVRASYMKNMITRDDFNHLLAKESGRMILSGWLVVAAVALVPHALREANRNCTIIVSFVVVFAYVISDMVYGLLAQLSVRLLVRLCGKFWLHGGSPLTRNEELGRARVLAKAE